MNDDAKLIFDTDNGEVEAQVLFTCTLEETGKDYVVFIAPNPETGVKEVSAACYVEADGLSGELSEVETDEEYEILEDYLNAYCDENDVDLDELLK